MATRITTTDRQVAAFQALPVAAIEDDEKFEAALAKLTPTARALALALRDEG